MCPPPARSPERLESVTTEARLPPTGAQATVRSRIREGRLFQDHHRAGPGRGCHSAWITPSLTRGTLKWSAIDHGTSSA
jgi:hypothetical protein